MKFFNFLKTYARRTVRDRMFLIIMLVFPMLLIWLLGSAFSGIMGGGGSEGGMGKAHIVYTVTEESRLSEAFEQYLAGHENDYFSIEEAENADSAMEAVRRNAVDAYIEVGAESVLIFKNSSYNYMSSLAELVIGAFVDEYNLIYEIISTSPESMQLMPDTTQKTFTGETALERERTPGSMDYYGVTISTMFIFYGVIFLGTYFAGNRTNKTEDRIRSSPVSLTSYQWGTATGSIMLLACQAAIVLAAGILIFNVYWGDSLGVGIAVIAAEIVMVSALGTLLGLLIKNENVIAGISQVLIPAIVFLGDGYVQIGGEGAILAIKKISPMYWINHGIFDAVYLNDFKNASISIIISISVAVVCTAAVALVNSGRGIRNA